MCYSPECVEGVFCEVELPLNGVLRSSPSDAKIVHLGDAAFGRDVLQFSYARTPVPRERQTRREAGAQSPWTSLQGGGSRATERWWGHTEMP